MCAEKYYKWIPTPFWRRYETIIKHPSYKFCDKSQICHKCDHWAMGTITEEVPIKYYCRYCLVIEFGEKYGEGKW